MSAQHTPGPWDAAIEDGCHAVIASISDTPKAVAVVGNHTPKDGRQAERFANARLIASAPDLLAALKEMNRAYVNLLELGRDRIVERGGTCDPVDVMEARDPFLKASRAAIAKAEGEQA